MIKVSVLAKNGCTIEMESTTEPNTNDVDNGRWYGETTMERLVKIFINRYEYNILFS